LATVAVFAVLIGRFTGTKGAFALDVVEGRGYPVVLPLSFLSSSAFKLSFDDDVDKERPRFALST
jgi:hypothetical protein